MTAVTTTRDVLLRRTGLAYVEPGGGPAPEACLQALELHLADLGYAPSTRLRAVFAQVVDLAAANLLA